MTSKTLLWVIIGIILLSLTVCTALADPNDPATFGNLTHVTVDIGGSEGIVNATGRIDGASIFQNGSIVIDATDESSLNVNSSDFWDALDSPSDIIILGTISTGVWQATAIVDAFLSSLNASKLFNLEALINAITLDANNITNVPWINESVANDRYINQTDESSLNVNSSDFWDSLDTPSQLVDSHLHDFSNITSEPWIEDAQEPNLNVNSSNFWDSLNVPSELVNSHLHDFSNITAEPWLEDSQEPNLNVNSSNFWDDNDVPSDIQDELLIDCGNVSNAASDLCTIIDSNITVGDGLVRVVNEVNLSLPFTDARYFTQSAALAQFRNLSDEIDWTNLTNFPAPCPADTFITELNDSVTCTGISDVFVLNTGDVMDGNYTITGDLNITGTLFGGSPLKIGVDINLTGSSPSLFGAGDLTFKNASGTTIFSMSTLFSNNEILSWGAGGAQIRHTISDDSFTFKNDNTGELLILKNGVMDILRDDTAAILHVNSTELDISNMIGNPAIKVNSSFIVVNGSGDQLLRARWFSPATAELILPGGPSIRVNNPGTSSDEFITRGDQGEYIGIRSGDVRFGDMNWLFFNETDSGDTDIIGGGDVITWKNGSSTVLFSMSTLFGNNEILKWGENGAQVRHEIDTDSFVFKDDFTGEIARLKNGVLELFLDDASTILRVNASGIDISAMPGNPEFKVNSSFIVVNGSGDQLLRARWFSPSTSELILPGGLTLRSNNPGGSGDSLIIRGDQGNYFEFGENSLTMGDIDQTANYLIVNETDTGNTQLIPRNNLTITSELSINGISSDGADKALCIKSDGNIGTCSNAVNASGQCGCT